MNWRANTAKRQADLTMYQAMAFHLLQQKGTSEKRRTVLSFPGPTWAWEQGLADAFAGLKFDFTGLERDTKVHAKLAKACDYLGANYHMAKSPVSFDEYAVRCRRSFDVIYLDWMGTWSREKKSDIERLFECDLLRPGGLLIVTVCLRRGRPESIDELHDLSYDLPLAFYDARGRDKYVDSVKVRGIPHWIQNAAHEHRVKLRPLMASVYYSENGKKGECSTPQLQIMMKRE